MLKFICVALALLLPVLWIEEDLAQTYPTPTAKQQTLWVCELTECVTGNHDTYDGQFHVISKITNLKLTLIQERLNDQTNRVRWVLNYDFYNGTGTWTAHGSQDAEFQFQTKSGEQKDYYVLHQIDRGHCVYGHPEHRYATGYFSSDHYDAIIGANLTIPLLTGFQNPC